jgi:hypothetical protein
MMESKRLLSLAIGGLAALNVALGVAVFMRSSEPQAMAQVAGRADIIAVSAHYAAQGAGAGVLVLMDDRTGQMAVIRPDRQGNIVRVLSQRNAAQDLQRFK